MRPGRVRWNGTSCSESVRYGIRISREQKEWKLVVGWVEVRKVYPERNVSRSLLPEVSWSGIKMKVKEGDGFG